MKRAFNYLLIVCVAAIAVACNEDRKSYNDMLKDERKAINRLIASEGLEILKNYPADGKFKDNQFYKLDNDVYINVVDTGNGRRAELYTTNILARWTANYIMEDSLILSNYGPNSNGTKPIEFRYGYSTAITDANTGTLEYYMGLSVGLGMQSGLEYVGDRGIVKMIVPFKMGSSSDNSSGAPVYFEILEYKFAD